MSDQVTFFNDGNFGAEATMPPPRQNPYQQQVRRVFLYDNQVFEDPGPDYSNDDVLKFLAGTYPELSGGSWTTRQVQDEHGLPVEEVTFAKVVGEKGVETGNSLSPAACCRRE